MRKMTALFTLMLAGLLMALPGQRASADNASPHEHAGMPGTTPGMWDAKSMQKDLGLTDDQVAKLNAARDEQKSVMQSIMDKNKELMAKLGDQVKNKASDADITATLNDIDVSHKNAMEQSDKFKAEKDAILTPTQRAKMMLMHNPMRGPSMMHGKKS